MKHRIAVLLGLASMSASRHDITCRRPGVYITGHTTHVGGSALTANEPEGTVGIAGVKFDLPNGDGIDKIDLVAGKPAIIDDDLST